jgi:hypothetical protein
MDCLALPSTVLSITFCYVVDGAGRPAGSPKPPTIDAQGSPLLICPVRIGVVIEKHPALRTWELRRCCWRHRGSWMTGRSTPSPIRGYGFPARSAGSP